MFLLGALYVALVVAMLTAGVNGITVAVIAGGLALVNLFASDKLALSAMGAREVSPAEAPQLHAIIDRLCVQADLPKPKVAVANTRMPNAFALGRSPKKATVCATTGIMELLSPAELEGVLAHELTHVANRDVMVMTLASFFATIAAYIVQFGFLFGGGASSDDDDSPSFLVLFVVSIVVYVVSFFLMQALSRNPDERYASTVEFAQALGQAAHSGFEQTRHAATVVASATPAMPAAPFTPRYPPMANHAESAQPQQASSNKTLIVLIIILIVVALILFAAFAYLALK